MDEGLDDDELLKLTYLELVKLLGDTTEIKEQLRRDNMLLDRYMQSMIAADKVYVRRMPKFITPTHVRKADDLVADFKFPPNYSVGVYPHREAEIFRIEQKCEIAASGIEMMKEKLFKLHDNSFNNIIPYKVKMEAIVLELAEVRLDKSNFTRLLTKGTNITTGQLPMEKITRFFKNSMRHKEIKIERCRLDHMALVDLENKLEATLLRQLELGDSLVQINYDQLEMENTVFSSQVSIRNRSLFDMKFLLSSAVQRLNQEKSRLKQLIIQNKEMKNQVQVQRNNISSIELEIQRVQNDAAITKRRVHNLKYQLDNYRLPDVMDYITVQAQTYELNKVLKVWQRRVNIASRALDAKLKFRKPFSDIPSTNENHSEFDADVSTEKNDNSNSDILTVSSRTF